MAGEIARLDAALPETGRQHQAQKKHKSPLQPAMPSSQRLGRIRCLLGRRYRSHDFRIIAVAASYSSTIQSRMVRARHRPGQIMATSTCLGCRMLGDNNGSEPVKPLRSQSVLLAAVLLLGLGMTYYYYGLLLPMRQKDLHLINAAGGNWSDLYPCWLGAREVLLRRRNPYSLEITREIQSGYYGRPVDPSNRRDPKDQAGLAYPLYVIFPLIPFLGLSFATVRVFFTAASFVFTAG